MEVIDQRSTLLTNREVLELLIQAKSEGSNKRTSKVTRVSRKSNLQNHNTIVYETLKYLNECTPAPSQSQQQINGLIKAIQDGKFKLTAAEIMQVVNLRPKNPVEIQLIVEESEERLTEEQIWELVRLITEFSKPSSQRSRSNSRKESVFGHLKMNSAVEMLLLTLFILVLFEYFAVVNKGAHQNGQSYRVRQNGCQKSVQGMFLRSSDSSHALSCVRMVSDSKQDAAKSSSVNDQNVKNMKMSPEMVVKKAADATKQVKNQEPTEISIPTGEVSTGTADGTEASTSSSYFSYLGSGVAPMFSKEVKPKQKMIMHPAFTRVEIVQRTRLLVHQLLTAETLQSKLHRTDELNRHLMSFPASRMVAVEEALVRHLTKQLKQSAPVGSAAERQQSDLLELSRQCLALCGHVDPPRGPGICVLSIDGGGTRGMMGLEMLDQLEKCAGGKKISDLFDIIVGVSTGAIIASLLAAKRLDIKETREIYMATSSKLFNKGWWSFNKYRELALNQCLYNSTRFVEIIKETIGEDFALMETSRKPGNPKMAIVSCIVNTRKLQPHIFRNYEHPPGRDSHYRGSTQYMLWQAIQASSAAPFHFEEVALGTKLHIDGGVLTNNPTAIAMHESRLLWPNHDFQCVVSVGNGRSLNEVELVESKSTPILKKINQIVDSATDTELVHNCVSDLLPPHVYYRLDPYVTEKYSLDEVDPDKLALMDKDAQFYVRRNLRRFKAAGRQLSKSYLEFKLDGVRNWMTR
uniref:PNPLA domain-containing protein n=1 Tax=Ditylenchus dipsaci TaxID=166011 RepID=A0A915DRH2_9BILA